MDTNPYELGVCCGVRGLGSMQRCEGVRGSCVTLPEADSRTHPVSTISKVAYES